MTTKEQSLERLIERDMHRRAQKAEGAVQAALHEITEWRGVLKRGVQANWLAIQVLDGIEKALRRTEETSNDHE